LLSKRYVRKSSNLDSVHSLAPWGITEKGRTAVRELFPLMESKMDGKIKTSAQKIG